MCVPRWLPAPHGWRGFLRHRHGVCPDAWMTSTRISELSRRRDRGGRRQEVCACAGECVRAGRSRGGGVWRGTCQTAHRRGRDRREHCPICGTDRRDRYTGTLGRSGLANAGTATRGPDERIHMRRPADQHYACARICVTICMRIQHMHTRLPVREQRLSSYPRKFTQTCVCGITHELARPCLNECRSVRYVRSRGG